MKNPVGLSLFLEFIFSTENHYFDLKSVGIETCSSSQSVCLLLKHGESSENIYCMNTILDSDNRIEKEKQIEFLREKCLPSKMER